MKARLLVTGLNGNGGREYRVVLEDGMQRVQLHSMPGDTRLYVLAPTVGDKAAALRELIRAALMPFVGTLQEPGATLDTEIELSV